MIWALLLIVGLASSVTGEDELSALVVVFRHGDRTPEDFYNDPYENKTYWPEGFGQLTNGGKERHYELGTWLRTRYDSYLPDRYSPDDIYVQSDDMDRTIMSAASNLAGLYPPKSDQIWRNEMPWQPIPVHTRIIEEDPVVAMKKPCPKHDDLFNDLMDTDYFKDIQNKNKDLYKYLTDNTGIKFKTLKKVRKLYQTLKIESDNNLTLPQWTESVFPDKLKPIAELSFATFSYTDELAELRVGPMLYDIRHYFKNVTQGISDLKLLMFSAHDKNIAELLTTFQAYDYDCPPFTSAIIFELRKNSQGYYVNVYYKKNNELKEIKVRSCDFNCGHDYFEDIIHPIAISIEHWEKKCNS